LALKFTHLALEFTGWEDGDGSDPVEFEVIYYHPLTNEPVPLVSRSRANDMEMLLPPVTVFPTYELTVGIRAVDKFNAKSHLNRTVVAYAPNIDPDFTYTVDCWMSNYTIKEYCLLCTVDPDTFDEELQLAVDKCVDCECVGSYNLTGVAAFTQRLVERALRTAKGTNNVPALLVLAKSVSKLNNEAKLTRDNRPVPVRPPGSVPTQVYLDLEALDNLNQAAADTQLKAVLDALSNAVETSKVSKEELDQFGEVYREATKGTESMRSGDNIDSAQVALLDLANGSTDTGLEAVAAQGLLDAAGMVIQAADQTELATIEARDALLAQNGTTGVTKFLTNLSMGSPSPVRKLSNIFSCSLLPIPFYCLYPYFRFVEESYLFCG
jgi:hypothetical protein